MSNAASRKLRLTPRAHAHMSRTLKSLSTDSIVFGFIFAYASFRAAAPTFARLPSVACTWPERTKEGGYFL